MTSRAVTALPARSARSLRHALAGIVALGALAVPAAAHFLWVEVGSGGHPVVRLSFGEAPQEPTDANLLPRLAPAQVRNAAGGALVLASGDGAWTATLGGPGGVSAVEHWGVVDRDGETFLLEYYAKGTPSLAEAGADLGLPVELIARQDGAQIVARVRRAGAGVANSPVYVHLPSGRKLELTSDERGEVRIDLDGAGVYGLRARWMEERSGEQDGKAFSEVRHYTTLSFAANAPALAAAPAAAPVSAPAVSLTGMPEGADPTAWALLKGAHDSRQVLPADFPGFRCDLVFEQGDAVYMGQLLYRKKGKTEVTFTGLDDKSLKWVRDQVLNQVGHRRGGDFVDGDGQYPLQLGPKDDSNPYGQLIVVNDDMESSYRVRDNRVLEVTRVGDGMRFTISVIETMDTDDGKYLANHFVVCYRDQTTGALKKFEGYRDKYAHIDDLWMPVWRTVLEAGDATSPTVRTIRYRNIVRLEASEAEVQAEGG